MAMTVELEYGVTFGPGDGSDVFEWDVELDDEAEAAYLDALRRRVPFDEYPVLQQVLDEAYDEIQATEIDNFLDFDDEYVQECTGRHPVDEDEINDLVHDRDPHALEFFGLTELTDEELEEWDAYSEEMPDVCDFDEDFVPSSPFDGGWSLHVSFKEDPDDYEPTGEDVEEEVRAQLAANPETWPELDDYLETQEDYFCEGDIYELAFSVAVQLGAYNYVDANADEIDLNNDENECPYLAETEDEHMQAILIEHGALRPWSGYETCRFALETVNGDVLAFAPAFKAEVFAKYLQAAGITEALVLGYLEQGRDASLLPEGFSRDLDDDLDCLGIEAAGGALSFTAESGDGYDAKKLLEELGYVCDAEGDDPATVYFIK